MSEGRHLAAILFTDLEGFTADAHKDERSALQLLENQDAVVDPIVTAGGGRKIKSIGDGLLFEFPNARDALECAVHLQQAVREHNTIEGALALRLRVGIHLGDVEAQGTDILGDAVNIASRIEPLADVGGICLSSQVFDQVRNKVAYHLESLGPQRLKGISEVVEVFRVALPWGNPEVSPRTDELPRLAVLPFTNISPDPNDAYFADGLTEELITALSQLRSIRVIARTSVAQYRSTTKSVSQIGKELQVNSVLEGSVRKAGNQLRITVQLINAASEDHLWATTYDRDLGNVFAVQAEIAREVAAALRVRIDPKEVDRLTSKPRIEPESYLAYLRGVAGLTPGVKATLEFARYQFEQAIRLDERNAAAYAGLADVTRFFGWYFSDAPQATWEPESRRLLARAIELDPDLAEAYGSQALMLWDSSNYPEAEAAFRRSLLLNPSLALVHVGYAGLLQDELRTEEALREYEIAETLNPRSQDVLMCHALMLIWIGRLEGARERLDRMRELGPSTDLHMSAAEYHLARSDRAAALKEIVAGAATATESIDRLIFQAWGLVVQGDAPRAREILEKEEATLDRSGVSCVEVATLCAEMNDIDGCFRWVEKGLKHGTIPLQHLRYDPRLTTVRSDPRFAQLLVRLKVPGAA